MPSHLAVLLLVLVFDEKSPTLFAFCNGTDPSRTDDVLRVKQIIGRYLIGFQLVKYLRGSLKMDGHS